MSIPNTQVGGSSHPYKVPRLNSDGDLDSSFGGIADSLATLDSSALLPAAQAPDKAVYSTGGLQALSPSDIGAASTADIDAAIRGFDFKNSVRVSTTANITLSGTQTIDGVSVIAGDRVLVADQSTASQNGIYVVAAGSWSRAVDADADAEVTSGLACFIEEGTTHGGKLAYLITSGAITVGSTSLTFTRPTAFQLTSSAAEALATSASAGSSSSAARADHVHPTTGLVRTDGANAMAADLNMDSHKITAVTPGTSSTDAATVGQVTGGLVDWNSRALTSNTTLAWGKWYKVNASSGNITLTLPAAALSGNYGERITVVRIDNTPANTVTVIPASGESLNGTTDRTDFTLLVQWESAEFIEAASAAVLGI